MVLNKIPTFQEVKDWVNNNADVPNADYADSAGDANTLGGESPSAYITSIETETFRIYYGNGSAGEEGIHLDGDYQKIIAVASFENYSLSDLSADVTDVSPSNNTVTIGYDNDSGFGATAYVQVMGIK